MWMPHVWSAIRDALHGASTGVAGNKVNASLSPSVRSPIKFTFAENWSVCGAAQKAETTAARLAVLLGSERGDCGAALDQDAVICLPPCIQVI
jgi:hypothetical protein